MEPRIALGAALARHGPWPEPARTESLHDYSIYVGVDTATF
jgi:hypothetical protein